MEDVAFRVTSANQAPDHATAADTDTDAQQDEEFGVGSRGDELPAELADPRRRRAPLERCKGQSSSQSTQSANGPFHEHMRDRERWEQKTAKKVSGRKPQPPEQHELTHAKLNATDPDSRVMKDKMVLMQGYNAQVITSPSR